MLCEKGELNVKEKDTCSLDDSRIYFWVQFEGLR